MEARDILAILFAFVAVIGVAGGAINRAQLGKGLGTQFIRYIAVVVALPIAGALALQGMLTEAAVSVLMGALAYAFARVGRDDT